MQFEFRTRIFTILYFTSSFMTTAANRTRLYGVAEYHPNNDVYMYMYRVAHKEWPHAPKFDIDLSAWITSKYNWYELFHHPILDKRAKFYAQKINFGEVMKIWRRPSSKTPFTNIFSWNNDKSAFTFIGTAMRYGENLYASLFRTECFHLAECGNDNAMRVFQ